MNMKLNEALTLKGRIAIKNYVSETEDDKISWDDFNSLGYNTIGLSEDDFIEGIHIFKKGLNIEKSAKAPEPVKAEISELKKEEPISKPELNNTDDIPFEGKPVESPVAKTPVAEEPKKEDYTTEPTAEKTIEDDTADEPEEAVSTPTDSEVEAEAEADLENTENTVDLGNDVNEGIYKIAKTQWPYMYETLLRCKKKMGAEFNFEIIGEEVVTQKQVYMANPYDTRGHFTPWWGDPELIPVYKVKIASKIKNNNWIVIALVQKVPTQEGVVITPITDEYNVPSEFLHRNRIECDHCNTNRDRHFGSIVYNTETKEYRMVGKSCLKEYTGIDPTGLLALSHVYSVARHWDPMMGGRAQKFYDVDALLFIATAAVRLFGYVKPVYEYTTRWGQQIYTEPNTCTRKIAKVLYQHRGDLPETSSDPVVSNAIKVNNYINENIDELTETVKKTKEFMRNLDTTNDDFKRNIQIALSGNIVIEKQIGLVCCFPSMYNKYVEEEKAKADLATFVPNNEYYPGKIKDVVTISDIIKIVKGKQTSRGSYIISIYTKSGYEFTAFVDESELPADLDSVNKIAGEIYRFNEFRGKKSTTLNRVKFYTQADNYFDDDTVNVPALGQEGDKATFIPAKVDAGPIQEYYVAYNKYAEYRVLTITDTAGNNIIWSCSNDDVLNDPQKIVGKKVTAKIKSIKRDVDGTIRSYSVGGRVKVEEPVQESLDKQFKEIYKLAESKRLNECHFAELPGHKNKESLNKEFDTLMSSIPDKTEEQQAEEDWFAQQTYEDELAYQAMLDAYEIGEDGFCDGFPR